MQSQSWRFIEGCSTHTHTHTHKRRGGWARLRGRSDKNWGRIGVDSKAMQPIVRGVVGRFVARSSGKREEKTNRAGIGDIGRGARIVSPATSPFYASDVRTKAPAGNCTRQPTLFSGQTFEIPADYENICCNIGPHRFNLSSPLVCLSKFSR